MWQKITIYEVYCCTGFLSTLKFTYAFFTAEEAEDFVETVCSAKYILNIYFVPKQDILNVVIAITFETKISFYINKIHNVE